MSATPRINSFPPGHPDPWTRGRHAPCGLYPATYNRQRWPGPDVHMYTVHAQRALTGDRLVDACAPPPFTAAAQRPATSQAVHCCRVQPTMGTACHARALDKTDLINAPRERALKLRLASPVRSGRVALARLDAREDIDMHSGGSHTCPWSATAQVPRPKACFPACETCPSTCPS